MNIFKHLLIGILLLGISVPASAASVNPPNQLARQNTQNLNNNNPSPPLTQHQRQRLQHSVRKQAAVRLKASHMAYRAKAMAECVKKFGCK